MKLLSEFQAKCFSMDGFIIQKVKGYMVHAFLKTGQI